MQNIIDVPILLDKTAVPTETDIRDALGEKHVMWQAVENFVREKYPTAIAEWKFSGIKHGWIFRLKDSKRVIVYFLPRAKNFMVALIFGEKAFAKVLESSVSDDIKNALTQATPYAEGRGIRIVIENDLIFQDVKALIDIKLSKN